MKRIRIVFLTLALLVLAGCGEKEPIALSESKESGPPSVEIPVQSTEPVENTALQPGLTENDVSAKELVEAKTTEYVPEVNDTVPDEKETTSSAPSSSQPVEKPPEATVSEDGSQNEPEPVQEQEIGRAHV